MKLILIRHGLTDYNLKKKYCGHTDIGLSKIGKAKLKKIKTKLKKIKIDKVFCSDLKRSWQSARIIFGNRGYKIIRNPNLREINFGIWEGLNYKQLLKKFPFIYKKWLKAPFSVDIPRGEKMRHFVMRIQKEIKNIVKSHPGKTVAIVGHSGPMRVILNNSFGIKRRDFWKTKLDPKAIYVIEIMEGQS